MAVRHHQATLPNGLRVVAEVDGEAASAAMGFFIRTGARDEPPALMGVSHFLEHMMFKGNDGCTAADVNRRFDAIGANHNAFTGSEVTAYHAHVLPEYLPEAMRLVAELLRPALREADLEEERGVILEEIAMYADNPSWVLFEEAVERYYGGHPLGHRILGTPETVRGITAPQMRSYFHSRYSSDNAFLVAAGKFDFEALCRLAEEHTAWWTPAAPKRQKQALTRSFGRWQRTDPKVKRTYAARIWPGPEDLDQRRYAAGLLAEVLGDRDSSRLYWALVEPGIAESSGAVFDSKDGTGDFMASLCCPPDRADEAERVMLREIERLPGSITSDEVERVRSRIATAVVLAGERPAGRMRRLGGMMCALGTYRTLEEEQASIEAVTAADIESLLVAFPTEPGHLSRLDPA